MKLERAKAIPNAKALLAAPVGTTFVYQRELMFAPGPVWLVVAKLGVDRWVRAQSAKSLQLALAAIRSGVGATQDTQFVDDLDSKGMAKRLTAKEVQADGDAPHVGLFVGVLETLPVREERPRADLKGIAAARRAATTSAGAAALVEQLARFEPEAGATQQQQLKMLARAIGKIPVVLVQLLKWSNGHRALELMSIEEMLEVSDTVDRRDFIALNRNENGDHWGLALEGPAKGALLYGECDLEDPDADDIVATCLVAWLKSATAGS